MMGDTISSDVSIVPVRMMVKVRLQHWMRPLPLPSQEDETAGLSSSSASAPRTILGVEAPPGLLAIEDLKPDEYYQAADQIWGALLNLPEQIQQQEELRTANWVHTTDQCSSSLWTDYEYARKACDRTGARIHFVIRSLCRGLPLVHG